MAFWRGLGKGLKAAGEGLGKIPGIIQQNEELALQQKRADAETLRWQHQRQMEESRLAMQQKNADLQERRFGQEQQSQQMEVMNKADEIMGELATDLTPMDVAVERIERYIGSFSLDGVPIQVDPEQIKTLYRTKVKSYMRRFVDEADRGRLLAMEEPGGEDAYMSAVGYGQGQGPGGDKPLAYLWDALNLGIRNQPIEGLVRKDDHYELSSGQTDSSSPADPASDLDPEQLSKMIAHRRGREETHAGLMGQIQSRLSGIAQEKELEAVEEARAHWLKLMEDMREEVMMADWRSDRAYIDSYMRQGGLNAADALVAEKGLSIDGLLSWASDLNDEYQGVMRDFSSLVQIIGAGEGLSEEEAQQAQAAMARSLGYNTQDARDSTNPGLNTGPGDAAIINIFQRLIDPNVSVRQGEYDVHTQMTHWLKQLGIWWEGWGEGVYDQLGSKNREMILEASKLVVASHFRQYAVERRAIDYNLRQQDIDASGMPPNLLDPTAPNPLFTQKQLDDLNFVQADWDQGSESYYERVSRDEAAQSTIDFHKSNREWMLLNMKGVDTGGLQTPYGFLQGGTPMHPDIRITPGSAVPFGFGTPPPTSGPTTPVPGVDDDRRERNRRAMGGALAGPNR